MAQPRWESCNPHAGGGEEASAFGGEAGDQKAGAGGGEASPHTTESREGGGAVDWGGVGIVVADVRQAMVVVLVEGDRTHDSGGDCSDVGDVGGCYDVAGRSRRRQLGWRQRRIEAGRTDEVQAQPEALVDRVGARQR